VRKSERIRVLELEVIRQQYELEYLKITLQALMDANGITEKIKNSIDGSYCI